MFGIVGVCSRHHGASEDELRRMNSQITHRGPDDEGYFRSGPVGLGVRRLSIIDLAGGHQPIANEDETCWIVFNGEIYNYRELGTELRASGHRFLTNSDTETIVHAYEESGAECVHRLNGMFAFAIWDTKSQVLFLARDRLGVKPLYYFWDGSNLVFGSELKSLLACSWVPREINPEGIWSYLSFRYVAAPDTMWKRIHKLPPGHRLTLSMESGRLSVERYWDIEYSDTPDPVDPQRDLEQFSALLTDSVERRLIADVPVGILLSGGLDSSAVAATVAEVHNSSLSTFSVAFAEGGKFDETHYARQVAKHLGTNHHEIVISYADFLDFLPEFVWHTDEPLADPASVPLHFVSKLAAEQVKVVLSGEGADEVLAGYNFSEIVRHWERLARFQRLPRWLRDTLPRAVAKMLNRSKLLARLDRGNVPVANYNRELLPYMSKIFSTTEKRALWPDGPSLPDADSVIRGYFDRSHTSDPLHQLLYASCQDWLVEDLLMKADKMTMANSIELRVPFLDYRLVEWLATRPSGLKVGRSSQGQLSTKWVLRSFAAARLPASILERPKQGFPVPLDKWLQGDLGCVARDLLLERGSRVSAWFDRDVVAAIVSRGTATSNSDEAHRVWLLVVLELWARCWL